ncbi:hypothetical protein M5G20_01610 [Pseudomonas sp. TNT2022 ID1044]|uniref:hypothetical protein n=1 Tax=Pseudomonas sp. TNT2022 ID1044 TaxID=2942636 RepID=UPI00235E98FE|nr:hypothetical protein [Pseudomonas sp. TNT2022 ID1044]MDD0994563.1 hypothetical protein [Pseudomonas sp. TNT2022 ID1044]
MNKIFGAALAAAQYVCNAVAILLTIYLFRRWALERELNPSFDEFNPWLPGLILLGLGVVFKLARKGLAAQVKSRKDST